MLATGIWFCDVTWRSHLRSVPRVKLETASQFRLTMTNRDMIHNALRRCSHEAHRHEWRVTQQCNKTQLFIVHRLKFEEQVRTKKQANSEVFQVAAGSTKYSTERKQKKSKLFKHTSYFFALGNQGRFVFTGSYQCNFVLALYCPALLPDLLYYLSCCFWANKWRWWWLIIKQKIVEKIY